MPWKDPANWGGWFPFMLTAAGGPHLNLQRIIEGLLIAGVTGGIVMWGMQGRIEERITAIQSDVQSIRADVKELRQAVYVPRGTNP